MQEWEFLHKRLEYLRQLTNEAVKYAKAREQFGKSIYNIPVVTNMLIDMRVMLEANRAFFYNVAKSVDLKEKLTEKIEKLKAKAKPASEETIRLKKIIKEANLLTPMFKYLLTESANKITYDALQIHGGTGYMKEFKVERLSPRRAYNKYLRRNIPASDRCRIGRSG